MLPKLARAVALMTLLTGLSVTAVTAQDKTDKTPKKADKAEKKPTGVIEIGEGKDGRFRFFVRDEAGGKTLAMSATSYATKDEAETAFAAVKSIVSTATKIGTAAKKKADKDDDEMVEKAPKKKPSKDEDETPKKKPVK